MNIIRGIAVFIVIGLVVGLLLWQFNSKGYEEIERINAYVLYQTDEVSCVDSNYDNYLIICENSYVLRSGLTEYGLLEGLNLEIVFFAEVAEYIEYEIE